MSYNNYYMRLRVKAVQEFDRMYHEPEYKAKCHKRVWKRLGCYIFGISYQSYLDYLKMDVSDVPPTPLEAQQAKRKLVDKLLERELQVKNSPSGGKSRKRLKKNLSNRSDANFSAAGRSFGAAPFFPGAAQHTGLAPSSPSGIPAKSSNIVCKRSPRTIITRSSS